MTERLRRQISQADIFWENGLAKRSTALRIADGMQKESARRGSRSGSHPIAYGDQLCQPGGAALSPPDLKKGADQVAHHVVQESVAADCVDQQIAFVVPGGVGEGADIVDFQICSHAGGAIGIDRGEGGEVVHLSSTSGAACCIAAISSGHVRA